LTMSSMFTFSNLASKIAVAKQSGFVPVPAKELFFLMVYFEGFGHGELFIIVQTPWILHGKLTVEPFYGPGAVLDINATHCKEVGT
jgi:hypothetical protein